MKTPAARSRILREIFFTRNAQRTMNDEGRLHHAEFYRDRLAFLVAWYYLTQQGALILTQEGHLEMLVME